MPRTPPAKPWWLWSKHRHRGRPQHRLEALGRPLRRIHAEPARDVRRRAAPVAWLRHQQIFARGTSRRAPRTASVPRSSTMLRWRSDSSSARASSSARTRACRRRAARTSGPASQGHARRTSGSNETACACRRSICSSVHGCWSRPTNGGPPPPVEQRNASASKSSPSSSGATSARPAPILSAGRSGCDAGAPPWCAPTATLPGARSTCRPTRTVPSSTPSVARPLPRGRRTHRHVSSSLRPSPPERARATRRPERRRR